MDILNGIRQECMEGKYITVAQQHKKISRKLVPLIRWELKLQ